MTYLLRTIPDDLWARVKARAQKEGHTIRYIIVTLLKQYVRTGLSR